MSVRPHFSRTVRNDSGDLIPRCVVSLRQPGTDRPITQPVYVSGVGTSQRGYEWFCPGGVVDFYLDAFEVVDVIVRPLDPGPEQQVWADQWVGSPSAGDLGSVTSLHGRTGDVVVSAQDVEAVTALGFSQMVAMTLGDYEEMPSHDDDTLYLIYESETP